MFILNSNPENGFISNESNVMFKLGLNKEKCLEKINNADNKFAFSLYSLEENLHGNELINSYHTNSHVETSINIPRMRSLDDFILSGYINSNRLNCIIIY
jgi:hypothetical protein